MFRCSFRYRYFQKCRYIDNRYGLSIYRTPLAQLDMCTRMHPTCIFVFVFNYVSVFVFVFTPSPNNTRACHTELDARLFAQLDIAQTAHAQECIQVVYLYLYLYFYLYMYLYMYLYLYLFLYLYLPS